MLDTCNFLCTELGEQGINGSNMSLSSFYTCNRNDLHATAILVLGSNPVEFFCKQGWHWNVVKLCWTKVRQAAWCCPWSQWCWWRCSEQTFSLGFEEWGVCTFISVFCLRKGACCLTQLCHQFREKMGNGFSNLFFTLQHWRHTGDTTTGTSIFKDQQIETI